METYDGWAYPVNRVKRRKMMSRYTDADALIMALRLEYPMMPMFKDSREEWELKTEGYRKVEEIINEAPSIDIVRCKECKHWTYEELCEVFTKPTCFDDFCSYGEPKGEDNES